MLAVNILPLGKLRPILRGFLLFLQLLPVQPPAEEQHSDGREEQQDSVEVAHLRLSRSFASASRAFPFSQGQ